MKVINIDNQPWLSMPRTMKITTDGIRYRLFRASVTVAVITVAVAFLMNILAESLIKRAIAANTRERILKTQLNSIWASKLTSPGSPESIIIETATTEKGSDLYKETQAFAKFDDAAMEDFQELTKDINYIFNFFESLDYAKRRDLVHTSEGVDILRYLSDPENNKTFYIGLSRYKSIHFDMEKEELDAILAKIPQLDASINAILAARREANAKITEILRRDYPNANNDAERLAMALPNADKEFGDSIRSVGFVFDKETVAPELARQAQRLQDTTRMKNSIKDRPVRQLIAQEANILPADVNAVLMWNFLNDKDFAEKYLVKMADSGQNIEGLSAELLVDLAKGRKEAEALERAERLTMDAGRGFMGLGERLAWLLFVSLLVCGIGITNAMMMSVTERFTEIATLKCLGALDGFIMIMFVLESCFMGVVGGTIGAIIGALIGLGRMLSAFGVNFISAIPFLDVLGGMLISVILGTLLAAVAAVLPSWRAARLAPMEALRVE
jgi:putative ABC transport system permease protein